MSKINYSIVTTVYNDGFYAQEFCNEIINTMSGYLCVSKKDIHKRDSECTPESNFVFFMMQ